MVLLVRTSAIVVCLFASNLWAQNRVDLEFLPGLGSDGLKPTAAMVQARDGALYGSTTKGGAHDNGTLYQVIPGANPIVKTLYSFDEETYAPAETMIAANDGRLYGVTSVWKKLYRITPQPAPAVRLFPLSFEGSNDADDVLVAGSDRALYGTIHGDEHGAGGIYQVMPGATPKVTRVWTFKEGACSLPHEERDNKEQANSNVVGRPGANIFIETCQVDHLHLVAAKDGNLYGATRGAGKNHRAGYIYRVIPSKPARVEVLRRLDGISGQWDINSLIAATDGKLYGTTTGGGAKEIGTVFVIEPGPRPTIRTLLSIGPRFRGAKLVLSGRDNSVYGLSNGDARSCGNVFVLPLGGATNLEIVFASTPERNERDCTYGAPDATLIATRDGTLYGTVAWTGFVANQSEAPGGIFRITTGAKRSATRLLSFSAEVGYMPRAPLMEASDGNLYGTTTVGGVMDTGAIFQLQPKASKLRNLLSFTPEMEIEARSALTQGTDGRLYGAASTCCGSVGIAFRVDRGDKPSVSVFHRFESSYSDGGPYGSLIAGTDGYLYGLLPQGGHAYTGAIYRVTTGDAPVVTTVHDFVAAFGEKLNVPLVSDAKGNFYGTTIRGGRSSMGTIFKVTPGTGEIASVLFSFDKQLGFPNGSGLILGGDEYLYGTTHSNVERGGPNCGAIYRLPVNTPAKAEIVHAFGRDECWHPSELVAAPDGSLFIATLGNSSNDSGKILKISIGKNASVSTVGSFSQGNQYTAVSLYSGTKGDIYGVAGAHGDGGAIFRVKTGANPTVEVALSLAEKLRPDSLIAGTDGYMYGISTGGGNHDLGAILRYKPGSTSVELLYSFDGKKDGAPPSTPLIERDGYFYGLTLQANMHSTGPGGTGRVFRFRPPKQLTK
jgi:uncharacterized repeat protein (TIGR03803 family)